MGRPSLASTVSYRTVESSGACQGPCRVFIFCLLGVVTPALMMCIPLLMRFVVYGEADYVLSPSDMRILDDRISSTWCQGEVVKMNTSFTAWETHGVPDLVKSPHPLTFTKVLQIPDDFKEYWGFYLLKGSTFRIRTCAKYKGGSLLVVFGRQHLEHCAYIGDSDSAENSDEFSNSVSRETHREWGQGHQTRPNSQIRVPPKSKGSGPPSTIFTPTTTIPRQGQDKGPLNSQEQMEALLAQIQVYAKGRPDRYRRLRKNLLEVMGNVESEERRNSPTTTTDEPLDPNPGPHKIRHAKSRDSPGQHDLHSPPLPESGTIRRRKRHSVLEVRKRSGSGEDGAFENFDEAIPAPEIPQTPKVKITETKGPRRRGSPGGSPSSIWKSEHNLHEGTLNVTYPHDASDSESESSYSSSEEALAKCEGVLGNFYLKPLEGCGNYSNDSDDPMNQGPPLVFSMEVNVSGYYYFIFGSENEKTDNLLQATFELERVEYVLPEPIINCTKVKSCTLPLRFMSDQKIVVSVPQPHPDQQDGWNEVYLAQSDCLPRSTLYLFFVLAVPLLILLCAFQ